MAFKLSDLNPVIDSQTKGAQRITSWFGMLALIILAAEVILVIALFVTPKTSVIYNWFVPIILVFLLVFVAAYLYERNLSSRSVSPELPKFMKIEKKVKGYWFEFVHNNERIAFSVSEINFDISQLQFVLNGTAYTKDAKKVAKWKSSACAVNNLSVPEFTYFWEGEQYSKDGGNKTFSGIGSIKFPPVDSDTFNEGEGWFTSGNISELNFTGRYKIEFVKCTKEEIDHIKSDDQKWLKERYMKWKKSYIDN